MGLFAVYHCEYKTKFLNQKIRFSCGEKQVNSLVSNSTFVSAIHGFICSLSLWTSNEILETNAQKNIGILQNNPDTEIHLPFVYCLSTFSKTKPGHTPIAKSHSKRLKHLKKEPYISAKEPYVSATKISFKCMVTFRFSSKEPNISAKSHSKRHTFLSCSFAIVICFCHLLLSFAIVICYCFGTTSPAIEILLTLLVRTS